LTDVEMVMDLDELQVYNRGECAVFRKTNERYGGLSNMASGYPLKINGVSIRTSEALYQACRFPKWPEVQKLIIEQASPMAAKMYSKPQRADKSRDDWEEIKVDVMRWCLRIKLAQNWSRFRNLLDSTDDLTIVEESRKDAFWGALPQSGDTLVGLNVLGRLLAALRNQLRKADAAALLRVEPLSFPDFLLYGKPIEVVEGHAEG
jgi:type I restriction enzyme S subunit